MNINQFEVDKVSLEAQKILESSYSFIDTPEKHCIGMFAADEAGNVCEPNSDSAVRRCAIGAYYAAIGVDSFNLISDKTTLSKLMTLDFLYDAAHQLYNKTVSRVNDELGYDAVCCIYKQAIENAKGVTKEHLANVSRASNCD